MIPDHRTAPSELGFLRLARHYQPCRECKPHLEDIAGFELIHDHHGQMHESYLVNTVRDLVTDYIKTPECLVLLAQSMNNEAHLSSAAELVEKVGAMERCIGT